MQLQIVFYHTQDVTLSGATGVGGWPAFFETQTLAGVVNASQNFFPQASVVLWGSSHDLVMENEFTSTASVPNPYQPCGNVCSAVYCYGCVAPDELLLYGGTANTVWGNTFRDPAQRDGAFYAGLAEAESGDLIYNNNFSVDNPTVYLPYDIYTDACPDGYAGDCGPAGPFLYSDRWNVTPEGSGLFSGYVNGFSLYGNVLGPACLTQGGNFWSTYGDPLNPIATLPFVNVYNYSEDAALFPAHTSPSQASIRGGGDGAPLTLGACDFAFHEHLRIHESGLPKGTGWSVRFQGGDLLRSKSRALTVAIVAGYVDYAILPPVGYGVARVTGPHATTQSEAFLPDRRSVSLAVKFGVLETLTFTEVLNAHWTGLPSGTEWSVALTASGSGGPVAQTNSTTGTALSFVVPRGAAYSFVVSYPAGYKGSGTHGHLSVPSHALVKAVRFRPEGHV